MDPFTALTVGGTALKLFTGLFGESRAEKLQKSIRQARERLQERKKQDIQQTYSRNQRETTQRIASARQRAGEQAIALGRPQDVGTLLIPQETGLSQVGSEATSNQLEGIQRGYRSQESNLDMAEANATADIPTAGDYIGELGGAAANYGPGMMGLERQREINNGSQMDMPDLPTPTLPSEFNNLPTPYPESVGQSEPLPDFQQTDFNVNPVVSGLGDNLYNNPQPQDVFHTNQRKRRRF